MNRCVAAERLRLCVEKLRNSRLLRALFALIRSLSSHHSLDPELIRGSLDDRQYLLMVGVNGIAGGEILEHGGDVTIEWIADPVDLPTH